MHQKHDLYIHNLHDILLKVPFKDRRELYVPRTRTTMAMSRSFAVIAPSLWNRLPPSARAEGGRRFNPICLRPYHFLKLVSPLGANRTKSASVCLWLLRGTI